MATLTKTTFNTRIDVQENSRAQLIELLNQNLADLSDLYSQTKQAHWNVRGIHFQQLHELFDQVAGDLPLFVDSIAERVGTLGGYAMGTTRMAAQNSRLPEFPTDVTQGEDVVQIVAERWAQVAGLIRDAIEASADIGEPTTEDLFTEISRTVDKNLWFIEAHLQ
ncbi:MAG: DNA starvation/stationary phase protection protein Dps [Phototrophicaceae bacterium]